MKTCSRCGENKDESEFAKKRDGLNPWCKPCNREYQRQHYQRNKDDYKRKAREWDDKIRAELRTLIRSYLVSHPCVDCGEDDPIVLQFDHVRGDKRFVIGQAVSRRIPVAEVAAEIEKCEVRCANCHMRKTFKQLGWYAYGPIV